MCKKWISLFVACMMILSMGSVFAGNSSATDYESHWAKATIEKWLDKKIINGYGEGSFKPNKDITNAEFAQIAKNVLGLSYTKDSQSYDDVKETAWFYDVVNCISSLKVMHGYDNKAFNPNTPITREEAVFALANLFHIEGSTEKKFSDNEAISDWAQKNINAMYAGGYIKGNPDGSFNPKDNITRAEVLSIICFLMLSILQEPSKRI